MEQRENLEESGEAPLQSETFSAAQMEQYWQGVSYPAEKQDLIDMARSNSAPENVMSFMNRLPDRTYEGPADVEQEFSKIT